MCICAIAWQLFADKPVVILSNRDEFLDRQTLALHQWQDQPIIAGRDQKAGGTWLGTNPKNGRWAVVLNFRQIGNQKPSFTQSRGKIVTDFLVSELSPLAFARQLDLTLYDGFNLVMGDRQQAIMLNNQGYPIEILPSGLYVLSNGQPNDDWFKVAKLRGRVRQEVLPLLAEQSDHDDFIHACWQVLSDTTQAPPNQLPNTGLDDEIELALSSVFIPSQRLSDLFFTPYATCQQSIFYLTETGYQFLQQNTQNQTTDIFAN